MISNLGSSYFLLALSLSGLSFITISYRKEPAAGATRGPGSAQRTHTQAYKNLIYIYPRKEKDTKEREREKNQSPSSCVVGGAHTTLKMTKPMCVEIRTNGGKRISKETRRDMRTDSRKKNANSYCFQKIILKK